ncbi:MAG: S8/S53 family peptidase [Eubacterium sp.]|nr:S8/S53 family peptidase [Eubacterium sp.]
MYCNICGCEFDERTGVCPVCGWIVPQRSSAPGPAAPAGPAASGRGVAPAEDAESETIVIQEGQNVQPEIRVNRTSTAAHGVQGAAGWNVQPEIRVKQTSAGVSGGQNPSGGMPTARTPQGQIPSGGIPTAKTPQGQNPSGGIPTARTPQGQIPTSRVTVREDTDHLKAGTGNATRPGAGNATRPGNGNSKKNGTLNATQAGTRTGTKGKESRAERKEEKNYQKDRRVKAKPKHLALKLSLLFVLLIGVGIGVFFGIKALKKKQEELASIEHFKTEDVMMSTDGARYVKSQVLLRGKENVSRDKIQSLVKKKSAEIVGQIPISNDYQIKFKKDMKEEELNSVINEWKNDSLVASVSLHYVYGTQGGFKYTDNIWKDDNNENAPHGDSLTWDIYHPEGNNWAVESIWAPEVWDSLDEVQYKKVNVGVVDTVFDTEHKDLTDRFAALGGKKGLKQGTEELIECNPTDANGKSNVAELYKTYAGKYADGSLSGTDAIDEKRLAHGTHIAGIISANMDDEFGITGVAQNTVLRAYATSGQRGIENGYSLTSAFEYKYALSKMFEDNVRLVNISMDLERMDMDEDKWEQMMSVLNEDMEYFLQKWIEEGNDFLIVKSAGDYGKSNLGKAFLLGIEKESVRSRILAVGAAECDYNGSTLAGYKKTDTTNYGDRVDIYAPGPDVLSDIPGDRTEMRTGSSEAAAFVSGGCALVMGLLPASPMSEVEKIVLDNCYYQVADTNRGYLNVYMATEAAKNRGGDSSEIRNQMKEEIAENQAKTGSLKLVLDPGFFIKIGDATKIKGTAARDGDKKPFTFNADGTAQVELEEGTWTITLEADGYEVLSITKEIRAGETGMEENISLEAEIRILKLEELPDQEQLIRLLSYFEYGWQECNFREYDSTKVETGILFVDACQWPGMALKLEGVPGHDTRSDNPLNVYIEPPQGGITGVNKDGYIWIQKNVFNISDKDLEEINKLYYEHQTVDFEYEYYEYGGYFYEADNHHKPEGLGLINDHFDIENVTAEYDGTYYSVTFDVYYTLEHVLNDEKKDDKNHEFVHSYNAKLEFKDVDGLKFWSIYELHETERGQQEEGTSEAKGEGVVLQLSEELREKYPELCQYELFVSGRNPRSNRISLGSSFDANGKVEANVSAGEYDIDCDSVSLHEKVGCSFAVRITEQDLEMHNTITIECPLAEFRTMSIFSDGSIKFEETGDKSVGKFTDISCMDDRKAQELGSQLYGSISARLYSVKLQEINVSSNVLTSGETYYILFAYAGSDGWAVYLLDKNFKDTGYHAFTGRG